MNMKLKIIRLAQSHMKKLQHRVICPIIFKQSMKVSNMLAISVTIKLQQRVTFPNILSQNMMV